MCDFQICDCDYLDAIAIAIAIFTCNCNCDCDFYIDPKFPAMPCDCDPDAINILPLIHSTCILFGKNCHLFQKLLTLDLVQIWFNIFLLLFQKMAECCFYIQFFPCMMIEILISSKCIFIPQKCLIGCKSTMSLHLHNYITPVIFTAGIYVTTVVYMILSRVWSDIRYHWITWCLCQFHCYNNYHIHGAREQENSTASTIFTTKCKSQVQHS